MVGERNADGCHREPHLEPRALASRNLDGRQRRGGGAGHRPQRHARLGVEAPQVLGQEGSLLLALSGSEDDPATILRSEQFSKSNSRHSELHKKLQDLLDADDPWPMAAEVNVEAVHALFRSRQKKGSS